MKEIYSQYVIPSLIILIANVFSRDYGSKRYESVTAIFGWTASIGFVLFSITYIVFFFTPYVILNDLKSIFFQISILSLVTAKSRDYEKFLKPRAQVIEEKFKEFFNNFKKKR